jgi:hypothetical protein
MGFLDRLFGTTPPSPSPTPQRPASVAKSPDEQALERYRYMIKTAPPETVEQAHAEAFAKLTPEQRRQVLAELAGSAPAAERAAVEATSSEDPRAMARVATRAEIRQPGTMERALGGGGMGFGASLLSSFAMGFVGSMVAQSFFSAMGGWGDQGGGEAGADETAAADETGGEDTAYAADEAGLDDGGGFDGGGDFEI